MTERPLPEVSGIITAAQVAQTVDAIASVQQPDGNIPWVPGGHTDPWNLVEAAMALDVGGRFSPIHLDEPLDVREGEPERRPDGDRWKSAGTALSSALTGT